MFYISKCHCGEMMPEFISMFILIGTLYNISTEIPPKHVQLYVLIKHKFYIFNFLYKKK